jgi:hypothetical protein
VPIVRSSSGRSCQCDWSAIAILTDRSFPHSLKLLTRACNGIQNHDEQNCPKTGGQQRCHEPRAHHGAFCAVVSSCWGVPLRASSRSVAKVPRDAPQPPHGMTVVSGACARGIRGAAMLMLPHSVQTKLNFGFSSRAVSSLSNCCPLGRTAALATALIARARRPERGCSGQRPRATAGHDRAQALARNKGLLLS